MKREKANFVEALFESLHEIVIKIYQAFFN